MIERVQENLQFLYRNTADSLVLDIVAGELNVLRPPFDNDPFLLPHFWERFPGKLLGGHFDTDRG